MKKIIPIVIVLIIIIGIISATAFYINTMSPVSQNSEEVVVEIKAGTPASSIGTILHEKGLIKSEFMFKVYTRLHNIQDMQAGEYSLNKNMSVNQIIETLQEGPDLEKGNVNITFLEGKNFRWIAKQIAEKTNNTEDDVYATIKDEEFLNSIINKYWFITDDIKNENIYYSLEGYLFPDTYNFKDKDVTVQEIIEKMIEQMQNKLEEYKEEIQSSQISVHKLLTVASIVELEASNSSDRTGVSSVIYNRLKYNMALGSDVTTYYSIKVDMGERDLKQSELNKYNLYNTRGPNMEGKLPIGPICMVGTESIKAALHPEETDYLYFVADKNGKVYFAKNSEEQNKNIQYLQKQGLWYTYE